MTPIDSLGKVIRRFTARLRRDDLDDELREEVAAHIELRRRQLLDEGMDPAEAADEAQRMFGNVTRIREETREMWSFPGLESIAQDVRQGARLLWRAPVLTLVAVLSIGGGLAVGVGMFLLLNAVVFRPLSVGDGANIYRVFTSDHDGAQFGSSSYPDYEAFRDAGVFSSSCATTAALATVTVDGAAALHTGEIVSPRCFDALRLTPQLGRFFDGRGRPADAVPIVVSHSLWTRRFASDPAVIGRLVVVNGVGATVVAVAPRSFLGTNLDSGTDLWAPVALAPVVLPAGALTNRQYRAFRILARLDGVERAQAEAILGFTAARLRQVDSPSWTNGAGATRAVKVMRELDARFADSPGAIAAIGFGLLGAAAAVVAIACVNLATMLLARGAARTREFSIRLAIGASRRRLLRQLVTESLMIAVLGAAVATTTLVIALRIFDANRPPGLPAFDPAVDWRVMAFAIVAAVLAAVLFGLGPAVHAVRLAIADGLKNRPLVGRIRRLRIGARETLIVVQVTASIALLLTSTLFVSAIGRGSTVSPGFQLEGIAIVPVELESVPEKDLPELTAKLIEAASTAPGVEHVSAAGLVPLMYSSMEFAGLDGGQQPRSFLGNVVSPGYFRTLQIPLRAGRDFDARDRQTSLAVTIVSETLARSMWGTANPIGQTLVIGKRTLEVVGVAADIRYRSLTEPYQPLVYLPVSQVLRGRVFIHARVRPGGETLHRLEGAVRGVDPRAAVDSAMPLPTYLERALVAERATRWGGAALGMVQLALAVLSLWGLVSYAVERRTAEMGLRLALGATPRDLVRLMMRPALVLILAGVALGSIAGVVSSQVVLSTSVGLAPPDLVAIIPVTIAFTAAAMLSAWWPARRAGMADPAASLRRE